MSKMNIKNELHRYFKQWLRAIMGKEGTTQAFFALAVFVVLALILLMAVRLLASLLPIVTGIATFVLVLALAALVLAPIVIKYGLSYHPFKKGRQFTRATASQFTLSSPLNSVNHINLTATSAHLTVNFTTDDTLSLAVNIENAKASDLAYLWDTNDDTVTFTQYSVEKKSNPIYHLTLNIPLKYDDLSLNTRLVEGSFTLNSEGVIKNLRLEAVNSTITLNNANIDSCKLYGLNLAVNSHNIKLNSLVISSTGDTFNFTFKDSDPRAARLKTNTALSTLMVNGQNVSKSFSHSTVELWPATSSDAGFINLEFNILSATVNINH